MARPWLGGVTPPQTLPLRREQEQGIEDERMFDAARPGPGEHLVDWCREHLDLLIVVPGKVARWLHLLDEHEVAYVVHDRRVRMHVPEDPDVPSGVARLLAQFALRRRERILAALHHSAG